MADLYNNFRLKQPSLYILRAPQLKRLNVSLYSTGEGIQAMYGEIILRPTLPKQYELIRF